jgi:hypothetical protein
VPGQRDQYNAAIAEDVVLCLECFEALWLIPFLRQIALLGSPFGLGRREFGRMAENGGALEMLVAATMIGMEVGANNEINVILAQSLFDYAIL